MPPVEQFGAITKWMSDPMPKVPMKPPLQDKYHRNHREPLNIDKYHDEDGRYGQKRYGYNLESLRVEDRVKTLGKGSLNKKKFKNPTFSVFYKSLNKYLDLHGKFDYSF